MTTFLFEVFSLTYICTQWWKRLVHASVPSGQKMGQESCKVKLILIFPLGFSGTPYGYFKNVIWSIIQGNESVMEKCVHGQECMCKHACKDHFCFVPELFCGKGRVVLVETDFRPPFDKLARSNLAHETIKRLWRLNSVKLPYLRTHLPNSIGHGTPTAEGANVPSKG